VFDRTLLVLTTDHGHAPVRTPDGIIDVGRYLDSRYGIRITGKRLEDDTDYIDQFKFYDRYDVVAVPDAPRLLGLHVRGRGSQWYDRPQDVRPVKITTRDGSTTAENLAEDLSKQPYSRFVAMRAGHNTVQIVGRDGRALIHLDGSAASQPTTTQLAGTQDMLFRYTIVQGHDPLSLGLNELSAGATVGQPVTLTLPGTQWLARTIESANPGVISQIETYFCSPRAGDIVVFAEPGYGFQPNHSGHGSTTPQEMRVPLIFAGLDVRPGVTDEAARIESIMPTIVTALGFGERLNVQMPLDGPVLDIGSGHANASAR
jgi:arylsulfatase A-like enzyme